jgi:hypothetical protein
MYTSSAFSWANPFLMYVLLFVFRTMKTHVLHFLKVLNWSQGTQRSKKGYGILLVPFGYIQLWCTVIIFF